MWFVITLFRIISGAKCFTSNTSKGSNASDQPHAATHDLSKRAGELSDVVHHHAEKA
jgi:hypothetical protein